MGASTKAELTVRGRALIAQARRASNLNELARLASASMCEIVTGQVTIKDAREVNKTIDRRLDELTGGST